MSEDDRARWDARHSEAGQLSPGPPALFAPIRGMFPTSGQALEIACGRGQAAVWLALRGMNVQALDVSPVAIDLAGRLANDHGVAQRVRFEVWDLDDGLPPGPEVDLVLSHMYRDPKLYLAMADRVGSGGLLAVAGLSMVGGETGSFRAAPGELRDAFGRLEVIVEGEGNGVARFLGRKPS